MMSFVCFSTTASSKAFYAYNNMGLEYPIINLYIQAITSGSYDDTKVLQVVKEKVYSYSFYLFTVVPIELFMILT